MLLNNFSNAKKRVENMTHCRVFLTDYEVSGNVVKYCLSRVFDISSQSKLKLLIRRKQRNKIEKAYVKLDQISQHHYGLDFLCLNLIK